MESRHWGKDKRIFLCPVHNASTPCSLQAFGIRCIAVDTGQIYTCTYIYIYIYNGRMICVAAVHGCGIGYKYCTRYIDCQRKNEILQYSLNNWLQEYTINSLQDCPHESLFKIGLNSNTSRSSLATKDSHYKNFKRKEGFRRSNRFE